MSLRLDGINPLSYMGVKPTQPPNLMVKSFVPTANDFQNINIGTFWLVYPGEQLWFLISVAEGTATWVQIYPAGGGGGGASQFPCNFGIANEAAGILNIFGDGLSVTTGGSGNTVTIALAGDIAQSYVTDSGTAIPSSNVLRVLGGTNINTQGTSNAVTVNLDNDVSISGTLGVSGTTTLDGAVVISAQTDGVLQTNGAGTVTATNGTNGQVLIGGGTAPVWANLTSDGGTVIITNGPNTINLESVGGGGGTGAGSIAFYGYQPVSYQVPITGVSGPTSYTLGTAQVFTTQTNEGGGFYPGDGVGTPISFTAPVTGLYYLRATVGLTSGFDTTTVTLFGGCVKIITPSFTYGGMSGEPSGNLPNVAGAWFSNSGSFIPAPGCVINSSTTTRLSAGDVVTYQIVAEGSSTQTPAPGKSAYNVRGVTNNTQYGSSFPVTYVEGYILKEL